MCNRVLLVALAAGAMIAVPAAHAFPVSSAIEMSDGRVIQVSGGCGIGWYRGPWGVCHPYRRPDVYGPYAYVPPPYPGRCWWVAGPYGARRVCAW